MICDQPLRCSQGATRYALQTAIILKILHLNYKTLPTTPFSTNRQGITMRPRAGERGCCEQSLERSMSKLGPRYLRSKSSHLGPVTRYHADLPCFLIERANGSAQTLTASPAYLIVFRMFPSAYQSYQSQRMKNS